MKYQVTCYQRWVLDIAIFRSKIVTLTVFHSGQYKNIKFTIKNSPWPGPQPWHQSLFSCKLPYPPAYKYPNPFCLPDVFLCHPLCCFLCVLFSQRQDSKAGDSLSLLSRNKQNFLNFILTFTYKIDTDSLKDYHYIQNNQINLSDILYVILLFFFLTSPISFPKLLS